MIMPMRTATIALLFGLAVVTPEIAHAGAAGNIYVTAEPVDTSAGDFEKTLKKQQIKEITAKDGQWTINFVAYLKKAAGADEVEVVFYDTAEKSREPTNAFPIQTKANAKILVSSVAVTADQNFKTGHTYNILVTRLIGGSEDVYARSQVTLK
jgi:hypothetical protein